MPALFTVHKVTFKVNGKELKRRRTEKELSLRQLGQLVGCTGNHLSDLERGTRNASAELMTNITRLLEPQE